MLKELNVGDKIYLYDCLVKGCALEYNLYEGDENWTAVKTQEEVTRTLQLLNKRIKYNASTAYETLQNAEPETANWEVADTAPNQPGSLERVLKLKYRVKGCPFNFEWHLKKQDNSLAIQLPINQIASLVEVLPAQIEELLDVLRRKEDEIRQYRTEYGSLRRSTLATKAFSVEKYREQYAATNMQVKSLQKIVRRWRAENADAVVDSIGDVEPPTSSNSSFSIGVKKEEMETRSPSTHQNVLDSPRNRKRKALQAHKARLTRTLQTRRPKLIYESQSQSLSDNEQPQDNEEVIGALPNATVAEEAAVVNENAMDIDNSNVQRDQIKYTKESKGGTIIPKYEHKTDEERSKIPNGLDVHAEQTRMPKLIYESQSKSLSDNEQQPQDSEDVIEALANVKVAQKAAFVKENAMDIDNYRVQKEPRKHTKEAKGIQLVNTSASKKLSPRLAVRPNTRQHQRECATSDNNSNELMVIENPSENLVYTVDEATESVLPLADDNSLTSVAAMQNVGKKCSTPALNICKMQQRSDDISLYVDSVLSQLDAFDKELKSQW
ncbi:uncharacterized protein [Eurosta solidaginis]|uniref:uncharacterized protein n=1 Tax=Eurosta solidaginis TaxID=178769 RepID=UPI003530CD94